MGLEILYSKTNWTTPPKLDNTTKIGKHHQNSWILLIVVDKISLTHIHESVCEWVCVRERASECVCVREWASECVWVSDFVCVWVTEWMCVWVTE